MKEKISHLTTESRNPKSSELDTLSSLEIIQIMNEEDHKVAQSIHAQLPNISKAVEIIVSQLYDGGRVIYFGAGTSGRLGVLDASECPPTFSSTDEFIGIIAGGDKALRMPIEGAEDSLTLCKEDLKRLNLTTKDVAIGLAASGRTPYCIGGLEYAKSLGCHTVSITCNPNSKMSQIAEVGIDVEVGPEVLTGSTRLKSGTAQKMILNMLSTASMVRYGKVYGNLMVDVSPTNEKLIKRAVKIVMDATDCDESLAEKKLQEAQLKPKCAIVMIKKNCTYEEALIRLRNSRDFVREAIK
jgi:N-acetylmuramic acid 6-phosphate etherase